MVIKRLDSFLSLKIFITHDLKLSVKMFNIHRIILDGLDKFLYTVNKPRKLSNDVFRLMKILRKLCFLEDVEIIIINCYYGGWIIDKCSIFNRYLGLGWCYMANSRYLLTKSESGRRHITKISGNGTFDSDFVITDSGIEFMNKL